MCHDWNQEYTECPTYHKQQCSAKGFFGRLFFGRLTQKKHCGRVIPHYAHPESFCPRCTIKVDQLRAKQVGDGALKVYRPTVGDTWRRPQESRKKGERCQNATGTRVLIKKSENKVQDSKRHHGRGTVKTTPNVWIPGLYEQPQSFAGKETYSRVAKASPPVSQRPSRKLAKAPVIMNSAPGKPLKEGKTSSARGQGSREPHMKSRGIRTERSPETNNSLTLKPQPAPVLTQAYHCQNGRLVDGSATSAPGLPPFPPPVPRRRSSYWQSPQRKHLATKALPPLPRDAGISPPMVPPKPYQILRHKPGQVHRIDHPNQHLYNPATPPLPQYQVYLNALNYAADNSIPLSERIARMPRPPPDPPESRVIAEIKRSHGREWPTKSGSLRKVAGLRPATPASDISDESFMCQSSKQLTYDQDSGYFY
ncbi:hypothetical protein GGS26DRAFT_596851 [Hypomontagnella submonticulosa]|nr:hypothetical protein GGS26DRAFT_596851 [Hypomontagnella submonticulosa]